jgi:pimeloyl-ACP methyl ester carboxylesterase
MLVLLVHGLGRTPVSLFGLAAALRRAGHRTRFFAYSPTFESLPRIVRRLTNRLRSLATQGRAIGLVGHSLGGLLLRLALDRTPEVRVHHFVMLGTPNRGSLMAQQASRWLPFRVFTGECGRFLAATTSFEGLPPLRVPCTVIAGTGGPLGRLWVFGREPNDGIVSVTEATIESDSTTTLAALHSFLMDYPEVRKRVLAAFEK